MCVYVRESEEENPNATNEWNIGDAEFCYRLTLIKNTATIAAAALNKMGQNLDRK